MMKKIALFCTLGFLMAVIFGANQAAAYSFLGSADLRDSGEDTEISWLNTLTDSGNLINAQFEAKTETQGNFAWNTIFTYGVGTYLILKAGNLWPGNSGPPYQPDHFAFKIEESYTTYGDLLEAIYPELNAKFGLSYSLEEWKGKSSHLTFATSNVPIPAAAWLLGSGLVGLVGVRRWRKRG